MAQGIFSVRINFFCRQGTDEYGQGVQNAAIPHNNPEREILKN
jgi:hypothetical protein